VRNISFALTTAQIRARLKTVTRRIGWMDVRAGDKLMACEKCMGRKKGEPLVRLVVILVDSVRRERLRQMTDVPRYGRAEVIAEGFPDMTPAAFVKFFCASHKGATRETVVTRIRFRYLEDEAVVPSVAPADRAQLEFAFP